MKISQYLAAICSAILLVSTFWACENPPFPTVSNDQALRDQIRGVWVPVSLTMKYQVGPAPRSRDTLVTVTPTTAPLLVTGRANPIRPFTDTLYFAAQTASADTFWLANRGIRQQGKFSLAKVTDESGEATLLRIGRPTYTNGQISRWNYDFVFHGTVAPNASGAPVYTSSTYTNYSPTITSITDRQITITFSAQGNITVPVVPITPANQGLVTSWGGRLIVFTATYAKQ
ncbi:hypothetical protein [Arundinibacter roseus]|uniref:Lipocalin-like domain-containing protein n=1 Tax=Arundinibacter roseus TaxID=2070510 RepID=A0A4R4K4H8_9BACT|nr:hypothetical protein [Arundinibacter roseus]TDB62327.1 hypothetical protein EZE20_18265 [Arundinibacter roseus]